MTKATRQKYAGSTSSLGPTLAHLYFLVSRFRGVTPRNVSHAFQKESKNFTQASRQPAITTISPSDGVFAVDATKLDSNYNVLSDLGTILEKIFTSPKGALDEYLRHEHATHIVEDAAASTMPEHPLVTVGTVPPDSGANSENPTKSAPDSTLDSSLASAKEDRKPEAYRFSKVGDLLVRSQLDCFHPNLSRKVFDLKTRATVAVRLDVSNYKDYVGYKLTRYRGLFSSYEREYYDMIRSAFLKYSFQVRLGRMDGIMVAYHNTDEIFGFQYIPLSEIDICVFGNSVMGRASFSLCVQLLNVILNKVTSSVKSSVRILEVIGKGIIEEWY